MSCWWHCMLLLYQFSLLPLSSYTNFICYCCCCCFFIQSYFYPCSCFGCAMVVVMMILFVYLIKVWGVTKLPFFLALIFFVCACCCCFRSFFVSCFYFVQHWKWATKSKRAILSAYWLHFGSCFWCSRQMLRFFHVFFSVYFFGYGILRAIFFGKKERQKTRNQDVNRKYWDRERENEKLVTSVDAWFDFILLSFIKPN